MIMYTEQFNSEWFTVGQRYTSPKVSLADVDASSNSVLLSVDGFWFKKADDWAYKQTKANGTWN